MRQIRVMLEEGMPMEGIMNYLRCQVAVNALEIERGNCTRAARRLGIHRNTFQKMLELSGSTSTEVLGELRSQNRIPPRTWVSVRGRRSA